MVPAGLHLQDRHLGASVHARQWDRADRDRELRASAGGRQTQHGRTGLRPLGAGGLRDPRGCRTSTHHHARQAAAFRLGRGRPDELPADGERLCRDRHRGQHQRHALRLQLPVLARQLRRSGSDALVNIIDLGTYVSGDTGTDTVLSVEDENGVALNLGGASAIKLVCRSAGRDVGEVAAAISGDPALGKVLIEDLANAFTPTPTRPRLDFVARLKWTQGGETYWTRDAVKFAIELFP